MGRLFPLQQAKLTTKTITSTQNWTAPATTNSLAALTGTGGTGSPATDGYYDPPTDHSQYITNVYNPGSSQSSVTPGTLDWSQCQYNGTSSAQNINGGGSGSNAVLQYVQYSNGYSVNQQGYQTFSNAVPGSAYTYTSAGWKTSGPIAVGTVEYMYVHWQEYGAYHPGNPATTGGTTTAFGYSFAGGYGGPASPVTYNNVPVTPNQSYPINVPYGGSVTLQYYE